MGMGAPFGSPPILVDSIMVDGEVANIGKTYANMYRIFMYMYISHILIYFPYVIPGAISLAKSGCLKHQNDQIHVKQIQERHFPEKKKPLREAAQRIRDFYPEKKAPAGGRTTDKGFIYIYIHQHPRSKIKKSKYT